jgi:hypothetical protein
MGVGHIRRAQEDDTDPLSFLPQSDFGEIPRGLEWDADGR